MLRVHEVFWSDSETGRSILLLKFIPLIPCSYWL